MAQDCMHAGPDGSSTTSTTGAGLTLLGQRHSVLVRREILGANGPVPLRRLPVHHFPVMLAQHLHGVVGFSKPTQHYCLRSAQRWALVAEARSAHGPEIGHLLRGSGNAQKG